MGDVFVIEFMSFLHPIFDWIYRGKNILQREVAAKKMLTAEEEIIMDEVYMSLPLCETFSSIYWNVYFSPNVKILACFKIFF